MEKNKTHITTIIALLFIIISGGYGIITLLNCKASRVNYNEKTLSYYEYCTNNLKGPNTLYCIPLKKNYLK